MFFIGVKIGLCSLLVKPFASCINAVGINIVGFVAVHHITTEMANSIIPAPRILIAKDIINDNCIYNFIFLKQIVIDDIHPRI